LFTTHVVPHFKQAAGYLSLRGPLKILDPPSGYIKLMFPINKQFSIDSLLDWEGHNWVCQIFIRFPDALSLSLRIALVIINRNISPFKQNFKNLVDNFNGIILRKLGEKLICLMTVCLMSFHLRRFAYNTSLPTMSVS